MGEKKVEVAHEVKLQAKKEPFLFNEEAKSRTTFKAQKTASFSFP